MIPLRIRRPFAYPCIDVSLQDLSETRAVCSSRLILNQILRMLVYLVNGLHSYRRPHPCALAVQTTTPDSIDTNILALPRHVEARPFTSAGSIA